jgi:glycerol kinase
VDQAGETEALARSLETNDGVYFVPAFAGLATGVWATPEDFHAARPEESVFTPSVDESARAALLAGWRRALSAARAWAADDGPVMEG